MGTPADATPDIVVGDTPTVPPAWALRQRHLIRSMGEAAERFVEHYTWRGGELVWRNDWPGMDGSDDAYESFSNFPLFYALGGGERIHELSRRLWDAVTEQFTRTGQVHREFDAYYDWMHHGESYTYIYFFGLADPTIGRDADRATRFAEMYTGDDPEAANYDREHKLIRSPINGSRGPQFEVTAEDWHTHRPILDDYPPPFEDIPGVTGPNCPWTDDRVMDEIITRMNARMMKGDVPLNLAATSLVTNAYLYTGDDKYKDWVLEYTAAWRDRAKANGGLVPDNVGPTGKIGELNDGKWWGGYYGYRWPHGSSIPSEACMIAAANAHLLTGDAEWLEFPRSQLDYICNLAEKQDGVLVAPLRHGDSGWGHPVPLLSQLRTFLELWWHSQDEADLQRIREIVAPDQSTEASDQRGKADTTNTGGWFRYVMGEWPEYPEAVQRAGHSMARRRMDTMRHDGPNRDDWDVHHWQQINPVSTEALVNLTLGAPQHQYHGGLLHCRVRYFDAAKRRPGLPDDVAALVSGITRERTVVELVNTSLTEPRELIIQAGGFGEHQFTDVRWGAEVRSVDTKWLVTRLEPGCGVTLDLGMRRYANQPTYAQPWHGDRVPRGLA